MMDLRRRIHPKYSVFRIYLSHHFMGRGILNLERQQNRLVLGLAREDIMNSDPLL